MPRAPEIRVQPAARGSERTATVSWAGIGEPECDARISARRSSQGAPELHVFTDPGVRVAVKTEASSVPRFSKLRVTGDKFQGIEHHPGAGEVNFSARWDLFLIREAWHAGCDDLEHLCDGYGPGAGTHGDWSGIRDSSPEAITRMTEAALNFLFPARG